MAKVLRWPAGQIQEEKAQGIFYLLKEIFSGPHKNAFDKGASGEWKVARELAASLNDNWIIMNDVKIKALQNNTQIDHLVFGPSGVFCLETKNWNTAACDQRGDWFRYQSKMWVPQRSPVEQHLAKVETLNNWFQGLVPDLRVHGIIVFANPGKFEFSQARLPDGFKVMGLPGLIEYLKRSESVSILYSKEQLDTLVATVIQ